MKVLVTGATGAIGTRLMRKLRRDTEYRVRILTRRKDVSKRETFSVERVHGDLRQIDSLIRASQDMEIIIHLAAITHTHKSSVYGEINHYGTQNLIRAAEHCSVRQFIFLSTKAASYAGGAYSKSKILAEKSLMRSKLNWTIIRPAEVYGMKTNDSIQTIFNFLKKGYPLPIVGKGNYTLTPVFIDDVVNGIANIVGNDKASRKIYLMEGPKEYTFIELIKVLETRLQKNVPKIYLPVVLANMLAYFLYLIKSKTLYRDQIRRLLCAKVNGKFGSLLDLGITPSELEQKIQTIFD